VIGGLFADRVLQAHVCYWHKADMLNALTNVRFWGQSGSDADAGRSPKV
jgi:hypothetical protein